MSKTNYKLKAQALEQEVIALYDKIDKLELANRSKLQLLKDMEMKYITAQEIISHLFRGGK